jgi:hypothetical protein
MVVPTGTGTGVRGEMRAPSTQVPLADPLSTITQRAPGGLEAGVDPADALVERGDGVVGRPADGDHGAAQRDPLTGVGPQQRAGRGGCPVDRPAAGGRRSDGAAGAGPVGGGHPALVGAVDVDGRDTRPSGGIGLVVDEHRPVDGPAVLGGRVLQGGGQTVGEPTASLVDHRQVGGVQ